MNLRSTVKLWLRDHGAEVVLPRRNGFRNARHIRLERFALPPEVEETFDHSDATMLVPIDRMVSRSAFPFRGDGWHPSIAALRQKIDDPTLGYRDTTLYEFYRRFQPETVHDVLLDGIDIPRRTLASWPSVDSLIDLWAATEGQVRTSQREIAYRKVLPYSQYRGPTPEEYGANHLADCLRVYEGLTEYGYEPSVGGERQVTGYFLTRADDYRFVIGHGNHRVPAMSVFGLTALKVTLRRTHLPVVAEERLDRWTSERGGLLESGEAHAVFDRFFDDDSTARAAALGLI